MALRPLVGVVSALAIGMALGFTIRPTAQKPPFVGDSRLLVEPAGAGRVRVVVTSKSESPTSWPEGPNVPRDSTSA